jgi:hypothetical protein
LELAQQLLHVRQDGVAGLDLVAQEGRGRVWLM